MTAKYKLAPGTQVREEDFGLLFYTQAGPRLYFLPSEGWLKSAFFDGRQTLTEWLSDKHSGMDLSSKRICLEKALTQIKDKGVLIEL